MPLDASILGLTGYRIEKMEGDEAHHFHVRCLEKVKCPFCSGLRLRTKARYVRTVRHVNFGARPTYLHIRGRKHQCLSCRRYFHQRFPGILRYRKSSEPFRRQIVLAHREGISQSSLARREGIGSATVERWYHEYLDYQARERQNDPCPRVLGIDEHFFTRRKGYATTLCNLERHRIFDVTLGRSEKSLEGYFRRLSGKDRVRVVCMDLASNYRSLVRKHFPMAKIVADRFHVIRLVNHAFQNTWKLLDPKGRGNRGLISLMRRRPDRLDPEQRIRLHAYLATVPGLRAVYDFQQRLCKLLRIKSRTARQCRRLIPKLLRCISSLQTSGFPPLVVLGKTLRSWSEEIVRMWRFTKNNGITEGFHNKMEMISRRAFGFRNFENYRLRVKVLCG